MGIRDTRLAVINSLNGEVTAISSEITRNQNQIRNRTDRVAELNGEIDDLQTTAALLENTRATLLRLIDDITSSLPDEDVIPAGAAAQQSAAGRNNG